MEYATFDNGIISVGQRIYCGLYGGKNGIVVAIHGEQSPGSCRNVMAGAGVMGGKAHLDIIWNNGTESRRIPESLARSSVQWKIYPEVASESEIADAKTKLTIETARRTAEKETKETAFREECTRLRALAKQTGLLTDEVEPDASKRAVTNIRRVLKTAFPKVKFSVRKDGYDCVRIGWKDGPTCHQVDALVKQFKDGHFDSMEDIYVSARAPWTTVYGSMQYVFTARDQSDALVATAIDTLWQVLSGNLKELVKPTPSTVFKTRVPVPRLSELEVGETVSALARHYDCVSGQYLEGGSYHQYTFVIRLAAAQQEEGGSAMTAKEAVIEKDDDGIWVGGIFCGKQIAPNLYAEEVSSRRYVIRETELQPFGRRVGEVMGGDGRFQACRMNGDHVGVKRTLLEAACLLV